MPHDSPPRSGGDPRAPGVPPRENQEDVEETIDPENEVDEASFESFPASDAPGFTGQRVGPADVAKETGNDEREEEA